MNSRSSSDYSPTFNRNSYDWKGVSVNNFGGSPPELADGGVDCDYWWDGDEDVFWGAIDFYNQCPVKTSSVWPPAYYTDEFYDRCDDPLPEQTAVSFKKNPTVHINSYNDESDPNYIVTEFNLRVSKARYNLQQQSHGGLACVVYRNDGDSDDEDFDGLGILFLNRFSKFPTEISPKVTSNYFTYDVEYFDADTSDEIESWFYEGYKPYSDYFSAHLKASISDEGDEYLITYFHREHFRFV